MIRRNGLSGNNPLSYLGVEPSSPINLISVDLTNPTEENNSFNIGDMWVNNGGEKVWFLVDKNAISATWAQIIDLNSLTLNILDSTTPVPNYAQPNSVGEINLLDSNVVTTRSTGNTVYYDLINGDLGQILIGGLPQIQWAHIISSDNSVTITPQLNPRAINLQTDPSEGIEAIRTDTNTVFPNNNVINIYGGSNINVGKYDANTIIVALNSSLNINSLTLFYLSAGIVKTDAFGTFGSITTSTDGATLIGGGTAPAWSTLTGSATVSVTNGHNSIDIQTTVPTGDGQLSGDTGVATPVNGSMRVIGSTNVITAGDNINTVTIDLKDNIVLSGGLTLSDFTLGVLVSSGTGVITTSNGTNGQLYISSSTGNPIWANLTSSDHTVTITNTANGINLEASNYGVSRMETVPDTGVATPIYTVVPFGSHYMITIAGGTNIVTSVPSTGANAELEINVTDNITIASSLTISPLNRGVVITDWATLPPTSLLELDSSQGADGEMLIGSTAGIPVWNTLTAGDATVTIENEENAINIKAHSPYADRGLGDNAFLAFQPSNFSIGSTTYYLGLDVPLTTVYDTGSCFFGGSSPTAATYTIPESGKYFFGYNLTLYNPNMPPNALPTYPVTYGLDGAFQQVIYCNTTALTYPYNASLTTTHQYYSGIIESGYVDQFSQFDEGDQVHFSVTINYPGTQIYGHATQLRTYVFGYQVV